MLTINLLNIIGYIYIYILHIILVTFSCMFIVNIKQKAVKQRKKSGE